MTRPQAFASVPHGTLPMLAVTYCGGPRPGRCHTAGGGRSTRTHCFPLYRGPCPVGPAGHFCCSVCPGPSPHGWARAQRGVPASCPLLARRLSLLLPQESAPWTHATRRGTDSADPLGSHPAARLVPGSPCHTAGPGTLRIPILLPSVPAGLPRLCPTGPGSSWTPTAAGARAPGHCHTAGDGRCGPRGPHPAARFWSSSDACGHPLQAAPMPPRVPWESPSLIPLWVGRSRAPISRFERRDKSSWFYKGGRGPASWVGKKIFQPVWLLIRNGCAYGLHPRQHKGPHHGTCPTPRGGDPHAPQAPWPSRVGE